MHKANKCIGGKFMRKRFMGKRLAAALLAAAVAFSSGNFAGGYEYVYAAEASVFYTGTNTVTKDKLDLATELSLIHI